MPLGDTWPEAELIQTWAYLYRNKHLKIPDSWQSTLKEFHETLMDSVEFLDISPFIKPPWFNEFPNPMCLCVCLAWHEVLAEDPGRAALRAAYWQDAQTQRD